MFSNEVIQELKETIKADYGWDLSDTEALETAKELAGYFDLLRKIYSGRKSD